MNDTHLNLQAPPRIRWAQLPEALRAATESALGAEVVAEVAQAGGFSPGLASRLQLGNGERVFMKAINGDRNPHAPGLYRREAAIMTTFPPAVPAPALRWYFDDGDWVALVLDDIDGHSPTEPWTPHELDRVVGALNELAARLTPSPAVVPDIRDDLAENYRSWRRLAAAGDTAGLPAWAAQNLSLLADLEEGWTTAAAGDTLLHADLRADNILLTPTRVAFVDWPYAVHGAPWLDLLLLLVSVAATSPINPEQVWSVHPVSRTAQREGVNAVLAAAAGDFTYCSLQPSPQNLPGLRAHQHEKATAALRWLRTRPN